MSRAAFTDAIDRSYPGLGELLCAYTEALAGFERAQRGLSEFMKDKPALLRRFELIGEIAQTTGAPLTEQEIVDVLTSHD